MMDKCNHDMHEGDAVYMHSSCMKRLMFCWVGVGLSLSKGTHTRKV
jgi:hypothetical protein